MIDNAPDVSDVEGASDLEYDENEQMQTDESDDTGSEFKVDSDTEDEEIMVDAAIRSSLQTTSERVAGPSSRKVAAVSAAAMRRALAAERRLALMNTEVEFEFETPWDFLSDQSASSEEEPLAASSKSKGKVAPRATKKATPLSEDLKKIMTMSELRRTQKEARMALSSARRANKKAERALVSKLGRRLTHASLLFQLIFNSIYDHFPSG